MAKIAVSAGIFAFIPFGNQPEDHAAYATLQARCLRLGDEMPAVISGL
jgi:hypothetical protein